MGYFFIFFDFGLRETRQNFEKFLRGSTQILKNVGGFACRSKAVEAVAQRSGDRPEPLHGGGKTNSRRQEKSPVFSKS